MFRSQWNREKERVRGEKNPCLVDMGLGVILWYTTQFGFVVWMLLPSERTKKLGNKDVHARLGVQQLDKRTIRTLSSCINKLLPFPWDINIKRKANCSLSMSGWPFVFSARLNGALFSMTDAYFTIGPLRIKANLSSLKPSGFISAERSH